MKKGKTLIIIAVMIIVIAAIVAGVIFFLNREVPKKTLQNDGNADFSALMEDEDVLYDVFCLDMKEAELEANYDFNDDIDHNLKEYEKLCVELERYYDSLVKEGVLKNYRKELFNYSLTLACGIEYLYTAPFETGYMFGGKSVVDDSFYYGPKTADLNTALSFEGGRILAMQQVYHTDGTKKVRQAAEQIVNSRYNLNYQVTELKEADIYSYDDWLNWLKHFGDFDVILMETHGEKHYDDAKNPYIDLGIVELNSYLNATEEIDGLELALVKNDLTAYDFVTQNNGEWFLLDVNDTNVRDRYENKNDYKKLLKEVKKRYGSNQQVWLRPKRILLKAPDVFFDNLFQKYSLSNRNPIMILSVCYTGNSDRIPNVLLKHGASAVLAYESSVTYDYSAKMMSEITKVLTETDYVDSFERVRYTKTLNAALGAAKEKIGKKDPYFLTALKEPQAVLHLFGDGNFRLKNYYSEDDGEEPEKIEVDPGNGEFSQSGNGGGFSGGAVGVIGTIPGIGEFSGSEGIGEFGSSEGIGEYGSSEGIGEYSGSLTPEELAGDVEPKDSILGKMRKEFPTEEELDEIDKEYQTVHDLLKEEGSNSIAKALENAMKLYFTVSCDSGYHDSMEAHINNVRMSGIGYAYYSDIIKYFAKEAKIGYYDYIYIDRQFANPRDCMIGYCDAIEERNESEREFSSVEKEAWLLIQKYMRDFFEKKQNVELTIECLLNYVQCVKENDINYVSIQYNGSYERWKGLTDTYFDALERLENMELKGI